jgi:hypothetical protein
MKVILLGVVLGVSGLVAGCSHNPLAPSAASASSASTLSPSASAQPAGLCGDFPCGSIPSPCKNVGCVPDVPVPCRTAACVPDPEPPCGQVACVDDRHPPEAPVRRVVDILLGR